MSLNSFSFEPEPWPFGPPGGVPEPEIPSRDARQAIDWPVKPDRVQDLGISSALVQDLFLRQMLTRRLGSISGISDTLKLSHIVVESAFRELRQLRLIEVVGTLGEDYSFTLTNAGHALATERTQICQYAGAAPVALRDYHRITKLQAPRAEVDHRALQSAYSDLVVSHNITDQLGPALISGNSIFLYGPTGNGKTSLAERILRVFSDTIVIPYAIEVDNQIITLFDPVVHEPIAEQPVNIDPRWVVCKRPCIIVGGELVSSMLELRRDASTGTYSAPAQMKANNGVFIIDDFGRQLVSPRDLLNRWIVPLDRRVDYLTLSYGFKFQIPFELVVVFSTNLDPNDLADEAFLRRIPNKVFIGPVEGEAFLEIFRRVIKERGVPCEPDAPEYLREQCAVCCGELRACFPRDICDIICSMRKYERRPVQVTKVDIDRAVRLYFPHRYADISEPPVRQTA
jgi:hypothetical protein